MGCVLKAEGTNFLVDAFLEESALSATARVFRKGEPEFPRTQPNGRVFELSSVAIRVSDGGFDNLRELVSDTIAFLKHNNDELQKLCRFAGVEYIYLDFGVRYGGEPVECYHLPPELLHLASNLGMGVELSLYDMAPDPPRDV
jgi:hypothetical protein